VYLHIDTKKNDPKTKTMHRINFPTHPLGSSSPSFSNRLKYNQEAKKKIKMIPKIAATIS
jgi:hypothetical protein